MKKNEKIEQLIKELGKDEILNYIKTSEKKSWRDIKSFEDACDILDVNPKAFPDVSMLPEKYKSHIIAEYKIMIVVEAINSGWTPDWLNADQPKYYPYFKVRSSGFGFSDSNCNYDYDGTDSTVGSRLCIESGEKCDYVAQQFLKLYEEFMM